MKTQLIITLLFIPILFGCAGKQSMPYYEKTVTPIPIGNTGEYAEQIQIIKFNPQTQVPMFSELKDAQAGVDWRYGSNNYIKMNHAGQGFDNTGQIEGAQVIGQQANNALGTIGNAFTYNKYTDMIGEMNQQQIDFANEKDHEGNLIRPNYQPQLLQPIPPGYFDQQDQGKPSRLDSRVQRLESEFNLLHKNISDIANDLNQIMEIVTEKSF